MNEKFYKENSKTCKMLVGLSFKQNGVIRKINDFNENLGFKVKNTYIKPKEFFEALAKETITVD